MKSVRTLIELAAVKCGSNTALATRLGLKPPQVQAWLSGKEPLSPENAALLCDVLELPGEETREWVAVAMLENPKNAKKAEALRRALFACWALGVALTTGFYNADATAAQLPMNCRTMTHNPRVSNYNYVTYVLHIVPYRLATALVALCRRFLRRTPRAACHTSFA